MADGSRLAVYAYKQQEFGESPSGAEFEVVRCTGSSLTQENSFAQSNEIRSDRQISRVARTAVRASGALNGELAYLSNFKFMLGAIGDYTDFTDNSSNTTGALTNVTVNNGVLTRATGSFITDLSQSAGDLNVGDWLKVVFATGSNAGTHYARVGAFDATTLTLQGVSLTNDASAGESVTITKMDSLVTNGTTLPYFSLYENHTEEEVSKLYTDMRVNTWSVNATQEFIQQNFSFLGSKQETGLDPSSILSSATFVEPAVGATTEAMAGVDNVEKFICTGISGPSKLLEVTRFGFELGNQLRTRQNLGSPQSKGSRPGRYNITCNFAAYFDTTLHPVLNAFEDGTAISVAAVFKDAASNRIAFDLPRILLTGAPTAVNGGEQDVIAEFSGQAFMQASTTEKAMLKVFKLA